MISLNPRNWLTRPATPAEHARALSLAGHAQHRARVAAMAERLRQDAAARPLPPRSDIIAAGREDLRRRRKRAGA